MPVKKRKGKKASSGSGTGSPAEADAPSAASEVPDIAETMASQQREISVSEFFTKNRHLLGFDNPRKALLTTVKEAVDNALDACEEAGILPDVGVTIEPLEGRDDRFRVTVEDNGPGIVADQIPNIFAKLLYGSKFHRLRMSRGQQGIGISAAGMYGQLTTGQPVRIASRTTRGKEAQFRALAIDTRKNKPEIVEKGTETWNGKKSGTRVAIDLEAKFQRGKQSVDEYLALTAIANPHVAIRYKAPDGAELVFDRAVDRLPEQPKEIKPHPYGVELGMLIRMMRDTSSRSVSGFLSSDFSRVSSKSAKEICARAGISEKAAPREVSRDAADNLLKALRETKLMAPPTDCLSPIGEDAIEKGLKKEIDADFFASVTRSPAVYRGNPFQIEAGVAYGGKLAATEKEGNEKEETVKLMRFANRVPLLYQQGACAVSKATIGTDWRNYGLVQPRGGLPQGPAVILVHIASAWVPFTSESKEAIAHYPEILKETKLALQECGRRLATHIRKRKRLADESKKRGYIEKYIPQLVVGLQEILKFSDAEADRTTKKLKDSLDTKRGKLE